MKSDLSAAGKYKTHQCKSHPGWGTWVFPQLKIIVLGWVIDKTSSLLFCVYGSGRVWHCLEQVSPPLPPAQEFLVILYT